MGSPKKRLQYRYDSRGNRRALVDQDGGRFTYTYDAVNRITQVINPQGDRTSYSYDAAGRRTLKRMANGTRASFSYDPAGNLTGLYNLKSNGEVISSFDYQYDRVGNRTAVLEADGSRVTWSYDATYQLTGEHRTGTTPYEDTYSYDATGNRLTKVHDGARTTYSYDAANQLEWSEDASGRTTYTFDADGNQQVTVEPSGDRTTNTWDYENRMTRVELPSGIRNTMAYEPGGLRVKLEESTGTKKFVWDEQNYLAETDENDDTQVVYTNEPRLYGNLVSQRRDTDAHWYHFDAIGSTRELTDDSAVVTVTRTYDAWGNVVTESGSSDVAFQFIGAHGYYTALSAVYARMRHYRPRMARWLSTDPLKDYFASLYAYVASNPVVRIDPSGEKDLCTGSFCSTCGPHRFSEGKTNISATIVGQLPASCADLSLNVVIRENHSIYRDNQFMGCGEPATGEINAMFSGGGNFELGAWYPLVGPGERMFLLPTACTINSRYVLDINDCYDFEWIISCPFACHSGACVNPLFFFGLHAPKTYDTPDGHFYTSEFWDIGSASQHFQVAASVISVGDCCAHACGGVSTKFSWGGAYSREFQPGRIPLPEDCSLKDFPKRTGKVVGPGRSGPPSKRYRSTAQC